MTKRKRPEGPIENYLEWSQHRYDPGHYLGGTISADLRKGSLGPRARRLSGWFLLIDGFLAVASSIIWWLLESDDTLFRLNILWPVGVGVLLIAAGLAMWGRLDSALAYANRHTGAIVTVVLLSTMGGTWALFASGSIGTHRLNATNRAAVSRLLFVIEPGMSEAKVRELFEQHRTNRLRLRTIDASHWVVTMPPESGKTDWLLNIDFTAGRVVGVEVGTSGEPRPKRAPKTSRELR